MKHRFAIPSIFILLVLLSVLFSGCFSEQYSPSGSGWTTPSVESPNDLSGSYSPTPAPTTAANNVYTNVSGRKVILTATISVETDDFDQANNDARMIPVDYGGYVESSSMYQTSAGQKTNTITFKVPQPYFEAAIARVKALGEVKSEQTGGQDVTRQFVDLNARLKNLRLEEQMLSDIMKKAGNVTEILQVERELSRVRGEIEVATAELNYLGSLVDFSTITVRISEPEPVVAYDWGIDKAFKDATHGFIGMMGALVVFTGYILPVIIYLILAAAILYAVLWLAWKAYKSYMQKKVK
jgi:hypothetical protein